MQDRKADTRDKIQLGGLVVKAGLRDENKAILLGALLDLSDKIKIGDPEKIAYFKQRGEEAFKGLG